MLHIVDDVGAQNAVDSNDGAVTAVDDAIERDGEGGDGVLDTAADK